MATGTNPRTKVAVIGCGMAGPVLAIFLSIKGYDPVIYERSDTIVLGGLSLAFQVNGLKVLSLIPGFVPSIQGQLLEQTKLYSVVPGDASLLAETDLPKRHVFQRYGGMGIVGVHRSEFQDLLVETVKKHGIPIKWGHQLVSLEQDETSVHLQFQNGFTDTASFVIGCDGLHSNTRTSLFGAEVASYTGLTQTGGLSPTPSMFLSTPAMVNIYGENSHLIAYPISPTHTSWAITRRAPESRETWRATSDADKVALQQSEFGEWPFGGGELVKTTDHIISYGLYDRPQLKTWYKGRVALLGDAAHPTSPHLGQGANQAFEDVYHLIVALTKNAPTGSSTPPSTSTLETAFAQYEAIRLPRSAALVQGARQMGETRVVEGLQKSLQRNDVIRKVYAPENEETMKKGMNDLFDGPFLTGQSEI